MKLQKKKFACRQVRKQSDYVYYKSSGERMGMSTYSTDSIARYLHLNDDNLAGVQEAIREKPLPVLYENKAGCCGCAACFAKCPSQAIYMENDEEGFQYPIVDVRKCVRCLQCEKVCPLK